MDVLKMGKFIAALRHEKGWTQAELGEKLGVTNKTVSRWENGNYLPDISLLEAMSDLFSVSFHELIKGERLEEESFRQEADRILASSLRENPFSLEERMAFWKQKWKKEHRSLVFLYLLAPAVLWGFALLKSRPLYMGLSVLLGLFIYMYLRNRMMIYVEDHVFGEK